MRVAGYQKSNRGLGRLGWRRKRVLHAYLEAAAHGELVSAIEIGRRVGIKRSGAHAHVVALYEAGYLACHGRGPGVRYQPTARALQVLS